MHAGLHIGTTETGRPLNLIPEHLETHVHGVGASRTGKSKLIEWIGRELVQSDRGFCLIDPHGTLYRDLIRWLTYFEPHREIILFDPSSQSRIVGFNPFQPSTGDISVQVERRLQATLKVWGQTSTNETPRLERGLRCFYHYLIEQQQPLETASLLLRWSQKEIWPHLIQSINSPLIREQWTELASATRITDFWDKTESTWNKLFRFLSSATLRRVMGLPTNNIDIKDIIENGKVLLVNLQPSDYLTEEMGSLIGTLLLSEMWEVASRRIENDWGEPPSSFFVIIDEFEKFLTPDIPAILNQGAKYGLHLFLFHQHLQQLRDKDESISAAVMANARTKLVFGGLTREDAHLMAQNIFPGQIDLKRIKFLLEQTKFWPVYKRETVHNSGVSGSSGLAMTTSESWNPSIEKWVPSTANTSNDSDGYTESDSDIPFLYPVPFQEVSSIVPYSLEESLWQLSDRLMEQYQRHFMIRIPGEQTLAAVTPFVKKWYVTSEASKEYMEMCSRKFLSLDEIDTALANIDTDLQRKFKLANSSNEEPSTAKRRIR